MTTRLTRAVVSASAVLLSSAALAAPPKRPSSEFERLVREIGGRSADTCRKEVNTKTGQGPYNNQQIHDVLRMPTYLAAHPEKREHVTRMWRVLSEQVLRPCFDNRLAGQPYSAALHLDQLSIGLNPVPLDAKRSRYSIEVALLNAAEHVDSIHRTAKQFEANGMNKANLLYPFMIEPHFIRHQLDRPDDSVIEQNRPLFYQFTPGPAQDIVPRQHPGLAPDTARSARKLTT